MPHLLRYLPRRTPTDHEADPEAENIPFRPKRKDKADAESEPAAPVPAQTEA